MDKQVLYTNNVTQLSSIVVNVVKKMISRKLCSLNEGTQITVISPSTFTMLKLQKVLVLLFAVP